MRSNIYYGLDASFSYCSVQLTICTFQNRGAFLTRVSNNIDGFSYNHGLENIHKARLLEDSDTTRSDASYHSQEALKDVVGTTNHGMPWRSLGVRI
jgi:hypothetical protein